MEKKRLDGKVALITGGAKGLGKAAAELFIREGASVILADVDTTIGETIATELGCTFSHLDVQEESNWESVLASILSQWGKLDILVNNAG